MNAPSTDPGSALGQLVREHRLRWKTTVGGILIGTFFTLMSLAGVVRAGIALLGERPRDDDYSALAVCLVFLLLGAGVLVWSAVGLRKVVRLYHGGFTYADGKGERAVPWSHIDGVYQKIVRVYRLGVEVDVHDSYTIALRDGAKIQVDHSFAEIDRFAAAVTAAVTDMLLPAYREAFRAGASLDFGPVHIDGNGVYAEGKMLPWPDVQGISWRQGILASDRAFLQIRRVGGLLAWAKLPIEEVKNYPVLMALAADIGKAE